MSSHSKRLPVTLIILSSTEALTLPPNLFLNLEFNFFSLFCPKQHYISAHLAAVALDGNANNLIGDAELAVQLSSEKKETENLRETIKLLKEQIESLNSQILRLDSNLKDKDVIIELLKDRK